GPLKVGSPSGSKSPRFACESGNNFLILGLYISARRLSAKRYSATEVTTPYLTGSKYFSSSPASAGALWLRPTQRHPQRMSPQPSALELALSPPVRRRALGYAVIVGAILITINHGDAILSGDVDLGRLFKMGLTTLVPYTVSTLSSIQAMRENLQTDKSS
ncbi:MAG: hypothetical protein ACI8W3_002716, partial [Myxococcota bacterium]